MQYLPIAELMQYCQAILRIPPKDFWQLTIKELHYLKNQQPSSPKPMTKNDLTILTQQYPDE